MPDYDYIARELSGKQVKGTLTAASEQDALSTLASRSLFPVKVEVSAAAQKQAAVGAKRVASRHLTNFYTQLADLLKSGVPLLRSLQLLEEQTSNPSLRYVIQEIREQVADGTRLNDAMRRHPRTFNHLTVSMVKAGEEGAFLEDVLQRIATFNDHQEELKGRVTGALVYPLFLSITGVIIVTVMMVVFVPRFAQMFDKMRAEGTLPWATTTLMNISDFITEYWMLLVVAIPAAITGIYYYLQSEEGRLKISAWLLKLPLLGIILQNLAVARFTRMLGTLLKNGVPILNSLRIAKDASGNPVLASAIGNAVENVSSGQSLAVPLRASGQFSRELVEMIAVGEEANNLENVLISVADNLERRTNRRIDMMVRLLEPMMLLLMAAVVLFIIMALLLPVLNMSTTR
ncbi:MAG: type II secretion system F family protein [Planctomycetaceae bacterium]|nr:type II secretion system F family protein [Planctomycetaceae bacterium]